MKPSPVASARFVDADAVDQPVEVLADPRLGASAVRRLEQDVHRPVEFLFCGLEVPLFELFLTGFEGAVRGRDEREDRVFDRSRRGGRGCLGDGAMDGDRRCGRGGGPLSLQVRAAGRDRREQRKENESRRHRASSIRALRDDTTRRIVSRPTAGLRDNRCGRAAALHTMPSQSAKPFRLSTISPAGSVASGFRLVLGG